MQTDSLALAKMVIKSSKTKASPFISYKKIKMKTSLINVATELSLSAILFLAVSSCLKSNLPECEKWEVKEEGAIRCWADFSCTDKTRQIILCGDGLKDASAGNTVIIRDDDCCRLTRTFIRIVP